MPTPLRGRRARRPRRDVRLCVGEDDAYTITELPDNKPAAAVALAVNSTGHASVRTVVLMTPEEVDAAATQTANYTPPGA